MCTAHLNSLHPGPAETWPKLVWSHTSLGWEGHVHVSKCLILMTKIHQSQCAIVQSSNFKQSSYPSIYICISRGVLPGKLAKHLLSGKTALSGPTAPSGSLLMTPRHEPRPSDIKRHALSTMRPWLLSHSSRSLGRSHVRCNWYVLLQFTLCSDPASPQSLQISHDS